MLPGPMHTHRADAACSQARSGYHSVRVVFKSHFARTPKPWLATGLPTQPAHVRVSNSGRECGKVVAVALVGTGVTCVTLLPKRAPRERNGERQELPCHPLSPILTPSADCMNPHESQAGERVHPRVAAAAAGFEERGSSSERSSRRAWRA